MKRTGICLTAAVVVLLAGAVALKDSLAQPARATAPATRVAVCDIVEVFDNYQRAKDLTAVMKEQAKRIEAEDEKRGKAIDAINMELESLKAGSPEHEKRLDEATRLTIERRAWREFQTAKNMRNHHRLTLEMYNEIRGMVARVAKEKGYHLVVHRNRSKLETQNTRELLQAIAARKVIFAAEEVDLTEAVLARLNQAFRALKSK